MEAMIKKPKTYFSVGENLAHCFKPNSDAGDITEQSDYFKLRAYELQETGALLNAHFFAGVAAGLETIAKKGRLFDENSTHRTYSADDRFWPTSQAISKSFSETCDWIRHHAGCGDCPS